MKKYDWLSVVLGMVATCCILFGVAISYAACASTGCTGLGLRTCNQATYSPVRGKCITALIFDSTCDTRKEGCDTCKCKPHDDSGEAGTPCSCKLQ
jgi:hypothetical protein